MSILPTSGGMPAFDEPDPDPSPAPLLTLAEAWAIYEAKNRDPSPDLILQAMQEAFYAGALGTIECVRRAAVQKHGLATLDGVGGTLMQEIREFQLDALARRRT